MSFSHFKRLEQGEILFAKKQAATQFYLIRSGEIGLFWEKEKHLVPYKTVGAKEFIGDEFLFSERGWPWTAIALSDQVEYLPLEKKEIHATFKSCSSWVSSLIRILCDRLADTDEILQEHNITDDNTEHLFQISEKQEAFFWRKLNEYREGQKTS